MEQQSCSEKPNQKSEKLFMDYVHENVWQSYRCSLRKNCPYSELFWPVFFRIRTEYGPE